MDVGAALTTRNRTAVLFGVTGSFLLVLLASGVVGAEPVRGDVAGFHQRVETDRTSYEDGDPVRSRSPSAALGPGRP